MESGSPDSGEGGVPAAGWILVLDDEPLVRTQVVRVLARAGFEARAAATLGEAQALTARSRPSLAIIDYLMPELTGDVALAQLRRDDPALPAILMSGYIRPDAQSAVALFNDRLPKPFSLDDLLAKVRAHRRTAETAAVSP
jgi:DNA-binding response OmpR family regulator